MKKIILTLMVVVSFLAPAFLGHKNSTAFACGEKMPETLLALYRNSETIHVGTFREIEESEPRKEEGSEDYTIVGVKRHFDVTSTLKGESAKFVTVPDKRYVYQEAFQGYETIDQAMKDQNPEPTQDEGMEEEEFGPVKLEPGDRVLLFLRTNKEDKQVEFTDYIDGLKKLSADELDIYETRIKEIGSILAAKKPDAAKIVDWLVRLAEDPATRWEGAYELEQSFYAIENKKAIEAERRQNGENSTPVIDGEGGEFTITHDGFDTGRTTLFARTLTDVHKQTLSNLLLNRQHRRAGETVSERMLDGDRQLTSLVARWADERVAGVLLDKLRIGSSAAYDDAALMTHIAAILGDKNLSEIAQKYEENSYGEDDEKIEDTEPAKGAKTGKKPALTFKRLRSDLMTKFVSRAEKALAKKGVIALKGTHPARP